MLNTGLILVMCFLFLRWIGLPLVQKRARAMRDASRNVDAPTMQQTRGAGLPGDGQRTQATGEPGYTTQLPESPVHARGTKPQQDSRGPFL